jgi:hypothetical protein
MAESAFDVQPFPYRDQTVKAFLLGVVARTDRRTHSHWAAFNPVYTTRVPVSVNGIECDVGHLVGRVL